MGSSSSAILKLKKTGASGPRNINRSAWMLFYAFLIFSFSLVNSPYWTYSCTLMVWSPSPAFLFWFCFCFSLSLSLSLALEKPNVLCQPQSWNQAQPALPLTPPNAQSVGDRAGRIPWRTTTPGCQQGRTRGCRSDLHDGPPVWFLLVGGAARQVQK